MIDQAVWGGEAIGWAEAWCFHFFKSLLSGIVQYQQDFFKQGYKHKWNQFHMCLKINGPLPEKQKPAPLVQ